MHRLQKLLALTGLAVSLVASSGCCCWWERRCAPYYSTPTYSAPPSSCYQPPVCSTASNEPIRPIPMPARTADGVTRQ
jgi:uncharacterized iron-regulated membrane protein